MSKKISFDSWLSLFIFYLFFRGPDEIAVSGLHNLRSEDLFGQGWRTVCPKVLGLRDGPVIWNVGLRPRKETSGHPPCLHGTLPQRTNIPMPVRSNLHFLFSLLSTGRLLSFYLMSLSNVRTRKPSTIWLWPGRIRSIVCSKGILFTRSFRPVNGFSCFKQKTTDGHLKEKMNFSFRKIKAVPA